MVASGIGETRWRSGTVLQAKRSRDRFAMGLLIDPIRPAVQ